MPNLAVFLRLIEIACGGGGLRPVIKRFGGVELFQMGKQCLQKFPKGEGLLLRKGKKGGEGRKHPVPQGIDRIYGFCALALDAIIPGILPPLPALDAIGKDVVFQNIDFLCGKQAQARF